MKLDDDRVHTDLWIKSNIEISKVLEMEKSVEEALEVLLKLRYVLPPIDLALVKEFKMPVDIDFYLN